MDNSIKQLREQMGLSQADLGDSLNVSRQTINSIEKDLVSHFEMFTLGSSENSSDWIAPPVQPNPPKKQSDKKEKVKEDKKQPEDGPDDLEWI